MTSLARWDPFRDIESMRDELGRAFRSRFGNGDREMWSPPVDVYDESDAIVLKAELPEMTPEQVEVECDDDVLTIKGERKFEKKTEEEGHHRIERGYGRFERSFGMPKNARLDDIEAKFHDGVLEIRVPKAAEASAKKIPIATA